VEAHLEIAMKTDCGRAGGRHEQISGDGWETLAKRNIIRAAMQDKELIEIISFLLKTQQEHKQQIESLSKIVEALRRSASFRQGVEIECLLEPDTAQVLSIIGPPEDETTRKANEMLRKLDKQLSEKG
jgi:hypothetical protein